MGAAILLLVLLSFHLSRVDTTNKSMKLRRKLSSMDPVGILLLLGAVCSLLIVLQQGGNAWPWGSGKVIGLLFVFAVLSALFGIVQWKVGDEATVPLRLLKDRTILMGSLFLALSNASSYVVSDPHGTLLDKPLTHSIRRILLISLLETLLRPLLLPSRPFLLCHPIWGAVPITRSSTDGFLTPD